MKFSIGDRVLLKRTGEEGFVVSIIDKETLEVEVNGTSFPTYIDELDHPYLKWFTEKSPVKKQQALPEIPVEKIIERKQRLAKGIYLSFMPVYKIEAMEEQVDFLKVYLLNELPVDIRFAYDIQVDHKSNFSHEGALHSFGNLYVHNVSFADMNDQPRFHWSLTDITSAGMAPATGVLRIKPSKLFEHIVKLMQKGDASFTYLLIDEFAVKPKHPPKLPMPPKPELATVITRSSIGEPKYELDLHIEQLIPNTRGLSSAQIITIQLETLDKYLQIAIVHRQERMVVIHGLGKGKLREEVHEILRNTDGVSRFKNEWSGKYGFGATEVVFKRG